MDRPWRIELLGRLCARQGAQEITRFRTQKTGALLAYLALNLPRSIPREALLDALWPEHDIDSARNSLSVALNSLRRQLEPPGVPSGAVLIADRSQVRLNPAAVTTDVAEFEAALQTAEQAATNNERVSFLTSAVELYRGELLPGHYALWVAAARDRLRDAYLAALRPLIRHLAQARDYERALDYAHRAVQADPLREESHRNLMRLYIALGRPAAAWEQYQELQRLLQEQLGTEPSAATRQLAEQLKQTTGEMGTRGIALEQHRHRDTEKRAELKGQSAESPARPVALRPQPSLPRLPMQFTRFFGREEEIARLQKELDLSPHGPSLRGGEGRGANAQRLITLTGPGGTGKTRLAIEVARRVAEAFGGAVWFVSLADLADPRLIPGTIADTLGLPSAANVEPLEQVVEFLNQPGERVIGASNDGENTPSPVPSLLVLDNFEQVAAGGAHVVQALRKRVPTLTLLVTSRRPLDLPGEQEFPVPSLPTPDIEPQRVSEPLTTHPSPLTPPDLMQFASVQLFVDRAQARRADFQITPGNAASVAALCAQLEGVPLAIELAAARARVLTPAQMLERLNERFNLLATQRADKGERHRSLWAAIDWSYRLLPPELQRFFARLSVFRGGWTAEAAEAVCGSVAVGEYGSQAPTPPHYHTPTLDFLAQLRSHSLIHADEDVSEMRFRMLESLREFAEEQLSEEERAALADRHTAYFLNLGAQARPHLNGARQVEWLTRLETEHDNFRAVLERCLRKSRGECREPIEKACASSLSTPAEQGLRLAEALARFWEIRGHFTEGREWLARALEQTCEERTVLRGKALIGAGHLAYSQGDYAEARALYEESLAICREKGISQDIAVSLSSLGNVAYRQGDYAGARTFYEESLSTYRALGDRWGIAGALGNLANVAHSEDDLTRARELNEESLAIWRELGDEKSIAYTLNNLANVAQSEGDLTRARALHEESLRIKRTLGNWRSIGISLANLGLVAVEQGDFASASAFFQEALIIARELKDRPGIANILDGLAILATAEAQAGIQHPESRNRRAAQLWAASDALREAIGYPRPPVDGAEHKARQARARAALGEEAFTAGWAEGRAMTLEQAIEFALHATQPPENG